MTGNLENSAVAKGLEEVSVHSNLKERQCFSFINVQMLNSQSTEFKLSHNCTHLTHQQSNAQNSPSQASAVCELRRSRCSSWIQKRQRNQKYNWQHPFNHRKSKRVPENICFCFIDYTKAFDCVRSVQSLSHVRLFTTPLTAACQASPYITHSQSSLKPISIESVILSSHLILCHPLLLLPSIFPSIKVFLSESALHIRWPKYWSFNFSISPSNEHPRLISFRMDWLDLLVERDLTVWITTNCAKFLKSQKYQTTQPAF